MTAPSLSIASLTFAPGCPQAHDVANLVTVGDEMVGDDTPVAAPPHRLGAHDRGGGFGGVHP